MGYFATKRVIRKAYVFVPIITGSTGGFGNHTTFFVILKANAEIVIDELTPRRWDKSIIYKASRCFC